MWIKVASYSHKINIFGQLKLLSASKELKENRKEIGRQTIVTKI